MNIKRYLQRIHFTGVLAVDEKTLIALHEHHVFNVPFENLDIHYRLLFDLEIEKIYEKVVIDFRGGFCYELNSLFNALLQQIGFTSKIISARIIDDSGNLGPEYDHMLVCIELHNRRYIADVGYGDLFTKPLEIKDGIQSDGRNQFVIQKLNDQDLMLSMSPDKVHFQEKYRFNFAEVSVEKFTGICFEKQTNPSSHFVKNIICTKPTSYGRVTLFNDKLIEKKDKVRIENPIRNDDELRLELRRTFGVVIR